MILFKTAVELIMADSPWRPCNIIISSRNKITKSHPLYLTISRRNAALFNVPEDQKFFICCLRWSWLETEGNHIEGKSNSTNLLVTVKVSSTIENEVNSGNTNAILHATEIFINHYGLNVNTYVSGFQIRTVETVALTSVVFYAQTPASYEYLTNQSDWKTKLIIKSCQQQVLCRKNDVCLAPLDGKTEEALKEVECLFDLHTLDCQPVNQGVIGPDTSVTVLETSCKKNVDSIDIETTRNNNDDRYDSYIFSTMIKLIVVADYALNLLTPYLFQTHNMKTIKQVIKQVAMLNKMGTQWKTKLNIKQLNKPLTEENHDWESAVFVTSTWMCKYNFKDLCWVKVWLSGAENKKRLARLYAWDNHKVEINVDLIDQLDDYTAVVTPQLWFNINNHPSKFVQTQTQLYLQPVIADLMYPKFAEEIHISAVNPSTANSSYDEALKNYFKIPRLVSKGDVICLPINERDISKECNDINVAFFTVMKLVPDINSILVDNQQSSLYQEGSICSYVPKIMSSYFSSNSHPIWDSCSPCGLEKYSEKTSAIILPYLHSRRLRKDSIIAVCIHGPSGCGKMTIMNAVSKMLNIDLLTIDCWDIVGESIAASEARLKASILKAVGMAPCLLIFKNLHVLLNDFDGINGEPVLVSKFQELLIELKAWMQPLVIIGLTNNSNALNSSLGNLFLHHVKIEVPNQMERLKLLSVLLENVNVGLDVSLKDLAKSTSGYILGDFVALISRASQAAYQRFHQMGNEENICLAGIHLMACDFDVAFSDILSAQSDAMGAPSIPQVKWEDVGGLEDIKLELINSVRLPLENPELLAAGMRRSGVLLYGPPGTGKTLLAKAVATEFSLNFISVKGPELLSMYVGQSEENVRKVFQRARDASPVIVFFDELDSLAPNRGRSGDSGGVMDRVVSQLLAEIDGLSKTSDVFVMAATNRPDLIDPALLRPGRFDKLLYVGVSEDRSSQLKILKALTRKFKLGDDVDFNMIIEKCPSCLTGADFYALCSDSLLAAVSRQVDNINEGLSNSEIDNDTLVVNQEDFMLALVKMVPSVSPEILLSYSKLAARMR